MLKGKKTSNLNELKFTELKAKAAKRKNNANYRHAPNNSDVMIVSENTKLLEKEQYKAFK